MFFLAILFYDKIYSIAMISKWIFKSTNPTRLDVRSNYLPIILHWFLCVLTDHSFKSFVSKISFWKGCYSLLFSLCDCFRSSVYVWVWVCVVYKIFGEHTVHEKKRNKSIHFISTVWSLWQRMFSLFHIILFILALCVSRGCTEVRLSQENEWNKSPDGLPEAGWCCGSA